MCAVHRWVSTCFWEIWISCSQSQRPKRPSRISSVTDAKANICHGIWVHDGMRVLHVWRYHLHGGIYWGCTVKYTAVKMLCFMRSLWSLDQDCMCYNSVVLSTQSECARLAYQQSRSDSSLKMYDQSTTDCWASEAMFQERLDKIIVCKTLTIRLLNSQTIIHCK